MKVPLMIKTLVGFLILVSIASAQILDTAAQSDSEDWSAPINLSNSGSTTNPQVVVDASGTFHAIWIDEFAGFVYSQSSDGEQWSAPVALIFPFQVEDSLHLLLPDPYGYVHAFWVDDADTLFYSRVLGAEFGNPASWQGATPLAESALDLDVIVDSTGNLHLSYIRPLSSATFPEGVYYRNSIDNGQTWSSATLLYQSQYFRSLERVDAHVQVSSTSVAGQEYIYVAWDNRPSRRIFMAYSNDGGNSWNIPLEIAGPDPVSNNTPFNIILYPQGNALLSIIQSGEPGLFCTQMSRLSFDHGATWSGSTPMYSDIVGCPQDNHFFTLDDNITVLYSIIQDQVYLMPWDGENWGDPQKQISLFSFTDPYNKTTVYFDCREMEKVGDKFFVIGCDANENGDIWITSSSIGQIQNWFPSPMEWSSPEVIVNDQNTISHPIILTDGEGRFHAIWLQSVENDPNLKIYYSRLNDSNWSEPVSLFVITNDSVSFQSAAIDSPGRIIIVWSGQKSGAIYASWANIDRADNPTEWANPIQISDSDYFSTSPSISTDGTGTIYIVFSVPINEGRGIYLARSSDEGESWTKPEMAIDAAAQGWDIVSSPKILSAKGRIHLIWNRNTLSNGGKASELYYSSSNSDIFSWSTPEIFNKNEPLWTDIIDAGNSTMHRVWLEVLDGSLLFNDQISDDLGNTWNTPLSISNFSTIEGIVSLSKASDNKLYLIHIGIDVNHRQRLLHWSWNEQGWLLEDETDIGDFNQYHVESLSSAINEIGDLSIIFNEIPPESASDDLPGLYFSKRYIQQPILISTPESISPTPTIESTPTATTITTEELLSIPTNTATPEIEEATTSGIDGNRPTGSSINTSLGMIVGVILSILLVGTVLLIGVLKIKSGSQSP